MDIMKTVQVDLAFEFYCKSFKYNKFYLKEVESLDDEQLAALSVKIYNYLKGCEQ